MRAVAHFPETDCVIVGNIPFWLPMSGVNPYHLNEEADGRSAWTVDLYTVIGRGGGIRTHDPLPPRQVRYQAALRPDETNFSLSCEGRGL